jgi:hypothetical protein
MWREIDAIVYQYIRFIGDQFLNLDLLQYSEADLEGACGACAPLKFAKHICYTTLIKQFNKQLFNEWLTRDL